MKTFYGEAEFEHGEVPAVGILLSNLGTPDAPDTPALKRFLAEFLSDPRVIELPAWKWQPILRLIVLPRRSPRSAESYRALWTDEGSPLLLIARRQMAKLETALRERIQSPLHCALGMRYGTPSMKAGLHGLLGKGCRRILHLPLYPQYSATTVASNFDALTNAMQELRWVPELRTINQYHDDPLYVRALENSVRELWERDGEPARLLISFHGIPRRYFLGGDPYPCQCHKTGRLLAEALGLADDRWRVSFQSRFGKEEWIRPYTDETLRAWGAEKLGSVDVICPGFSADCLETLEEIAQENRRYFEGAGGGRYRYVAALNDRDDHVAALAEICNRNLGGWTAAEWNADAARAEAEASRARAQRMRAD